ncbi:hypothetical protein CWI37_1021p0010 [Hamiltosporidium tvaerminnensis]|uniref:Uncharacterized protein n=1 Tax=Hamiltosporidium tvaerminnensis TaxID=1176355 RepID=A0A4Q9L0V3_9MICR|nr:hypothetical protein CWI37_1021p0010 [Hamiltosporidium tvaerminnensis]
MISANTTFLHKEMHEFTRAGPSRNEKSIIDYIMVKRSDHKKCRDSRRLSFTSSDKTILYTKRQKEEEMQKYKKSQKKITIAELNIKENLTRFKDLISEKTTILNIAEAVCGKYKSNGKNFKPTRWWFEFINTEIKEKKTKLGQISEKSKPGMSSDGFWKKIYQKIKNSYTRFYEMRNTKDCPLKFVLSKERELLGYEKRVMAKKREYFHELLNSSLKDRKSGINNNDNKSKNKENRIK